MARAAFLIRAAGGEMRALVGKVVLFGGIALYFYICLALVDAACTEQLSFCQLYEPLTPW